MVKLHFWFWRRPHPKAITECEQWTWNRTQRITREIRQSYGLKIGFGCSNHLCMEKIDPMPLASGFFQALTLNRQHLSELEIIFREIMDFQDQYSMISMWCFILFNHQNDGFKPLIFSHFTVRSSHHPSVPLRVKPGSVLCQPCMVRSGRNVVFGDSKIEKEKPNKISEKKRTYSGFIQDLVFQNIEQLAVCLAVSGWTGGARDASWRLGPQCPSLSLGSNSSSAQLRKTAKIKNSIST